MSKEKDKIIKYTIVPKNDNDDYDSNFKLSLTEFAKALDGKALLAPLILYNSDLDIPLDMDETIEDYMIYTDKDNLLSVIKKQETIDVFRSLIIHGFDISLDEVRDIYCPLARRNQADVCINTIQELELDSNLTFYLYDDLDKCSDEEWDDTKIQLKQDMKDYIDEYKNFESMDEEDLMDLLPFFFDDNNEEGSFEDFLDTISKAANKKKKEEKKEEPKKEENTNIIPLPLPEDLNKLDDVKEEQQRMMTLSYDDGKNFIALNKLGDDLYTIEDEEGEVLLSAEQIDYIMYAYNKLKDKQF